MTSGSTPTASWYLPDRLESIRNITDANGNVIDTITYDGFGNVTNESNTTAGDRWKYTGRELDSETGLQFNRARYYNPIDGRWTGQDPLGFGAGDENLYRYVLNSPTNGLDPNGLAVCINKIIIKDKGRAFDDPRYPLGEIADESQFAYGFDVRIEANVTGGDDITKAKIKQFIFALSVLEIKQGSWYYYLSDATHTGQVSLDVANNALGEWYDNSYTYKVDKVIEDNIFRPGLANYKHGNDWAEYWDHPGFSGSSGVKASVGESIRLRFAIAVAAQGTDGKTLYAGFWVARQGASDGNTWKTNSTAGPGRSLGPEPPLGDGKTWTPNDDSLTVNKPPFP